MVNDFVTNEYAKQTLSDEEIQQIKKTLVYRHIAWMTALRHQLRQPRPWEFQMTQKSNQEYSQKFSVPEKKTSMENDLAKHLKEDELQFVLGKSNQATQLLSLQSKHLKELKLSGYIDFSPCGNGKSLG